MKAEKSAGAAFALAFFFGPLGLLYVGFLRFFLMTLLLAVGLVFIGAGVSEVETHGTAEEVGLWGAAFFASLLWGGFVQIPVLILAVTGVGRHNKKVAQERELATETRHQEMMATVGRPA